MPQERPLPHSDEVLDTLGLYCPVPVWEAAKRIRELKVGQVLEVLSDDEGIIEDMPTWCSRTGHEFLGIARDGDQLHVFVRKREAQSAR